jgi:hypothetical protein
MGESSIALAMRISSSTFTALNTVRMTSIVVTSLVSSKHFKPRSLTYKSFVGVKPRRRRLTP